MRNSSIHPKAVLLLLLVWLFSCSDENDELEGIGSHYSPPPPGLLINSGFEMDEAGRMQGWVLTQHTGPTSYKLSATEGVAFIKRIEKEPWGALRQVFRSRDALLLQGKTGEFSADIAGEFTDLYGTPFQPASMKVRILGVAAGANPMLGSSILYEAESLVAPSIGSVPWSRHAIRFDIPSAEEASFIEIELLFLMTYGGEMRIRGPAFTVE